MVRLAILLVSAGAISGTTALVTPKQPAQQQQVQDRRAALGGIAAGIFGVAAATIAPQEASAAKALTGQASPFTG